MVGETHVLKIKPEDLKIVLKNKSIKDIAESTAINGTFFWDGKPNGILINEGKVLGDQASHAWRGYPQSVIYMTKQGEVKIKRINLAAEIILEAVWAIGGLGILAPYGYSPNSEGFSGTYSDVLRTTNKTFMGYKKDEDLIYLCIRPNSSHDRIIDSVNNLKLDFAISLDGGGSSSLKINDKVIVSGDGRKINNYIGIK